MTIYDWPFTTLLHLKIVHSALRGISCHRIKWGGIKQQKTSKKWWTKLKAVKKYEKQPICDRDKWKLPNCMTFSCSRIAIISHLNMHQLTSMGSINKYATHIKSHLNNLLSHRYGRVNIAFCHCRNIRQTVCSTNDIIIINLVAQEYWINQ